MNNDLKEQRKIQKINQQNAIKKLPVGKTLSFKFPTAGDPLIAEKYISRKVQLVDAKQFRFPKPENLFIGSLRVK